MPLSRDRPSQSDQSQERLVVYYDGACPKCRRDRLIYEKLAGSSVDQIDWFDITGQESRLHELGIDPRKALSELHVRNSGGRIVSELDAYILLMKKVAWLKPIAWLIDLPLIRPFLAGLYHRQVNRRLRKRGLL